MAAVSSLVFERRQPLVRPAGDRAEYQIGDAFDARWVARLSDGTYAAVNQAFYLADFGGRRFVESQVEYLVCSDLADPGGTELGSELVYLDHSDDVSDDPRMLAEQAVDTTAAEWAAHRPSWAPAE